MEQYEIELIIAGVILFFGIVSPFASHFFRLILSARAENKKLASIENIASDSEEDAAGQQDENYTAEAQNVDNDGSVTTSASTSSTSTSASKPVSLVVMAMESASHLEDNLPKFLDQEYDAEYEVIVVGNAADKEAEDVVTRLRLNHDNIRFTFMPDSSRYISRRKMGMTLGFKSAKHEWVIMTDAFCKPENEKWLKSFTSYLQDDKDVVIGYAQYSKITKPSYQFDHILDVAYDLAIYSHGKAITCSSPLIALRKKLFLDHDGFAGNLEYSAGEYHYLADKFSDEDNTLFAFNRDAWLHCENITSKTWNEEQIFQIHTMKHIKSAWKHKALQYFDSDMLKLANLAIIAGFAYFAWRAIEFTSHAPLGNMLAPFAPINPHFGTIMILLASLLSMIANITIRSIIINKVREIMDYDVSVVSNIMLEITRPFRFFFKRVKLRFTNKNTFITHKL